MKKLRLMQITHDLGLGGLQRVVADLSTKVDKERFAVTVCALRRGGGVEAELLDRNVRVIKLPRKEKGADYLSFFKLSQVLRKERPDIIHTHNTEPLIDGVLASTLTHVPVRIHTDHARLYPDKKRYMIAERICAALINQFVAVSDHTKENLVRFEKISPNKIKVIRNGIELEKYDICIDRGAKRLELGISDTDRYPILGLGVRLSEQKGIRYLLEALVAVKEHFPRILLLLAGGGELRESLSSLSTHLGLDDNVIFLGPRQDMNEILHVLDIFVLPSLWEGLPLVVLEAMAARKPIIATAVDGTQEAIMDGENGILVKPKDVNGLARAIVQLARKPELARMLADNAYRSFNENFTVTQMVSAYESLYLSIFANRQKSVG